MHVEERGPPDGAPLLLLHGFTGTADAWGEELLEALARRFRVLTVDLPGHGRSPPPDDPWRYGVPDVVDDLAELLDSRGHREAHWVGYSMGGRIALAGAVLRPDRVRRLVLESTSPGLATTAERSRRRRRDESLARRIELRGIQWFVEHWMGLPLFASQGRLSTQVLAEARARRLRHEPGRLAAALRSLGTGVQPSFWEDLAGIASPTLVLTGELDEKYGAIARGMMERLPRAVHRCLPDTGHTVHLEAPRRWLDAVVPFLMAQDEGIPA